MDNLTLQQIKQKYINQVNFRKNANADVNYKYDIMVCGGTGCQSCKSKQVQQRLEQLVKEKNLTKIIRQSSKYVFDIYSEEEQPINIFIIIPPIHL